VIQLSELLHVKAGEVLPTAPGQITCRLAFSSLSEKAARMSRAIILVVNRR